MNYFSTKDNTTKYTPREAVFRGLPPDNGLFMPESIPGIQIDTLKGLSLPELGKKVLEGYFDDIPGNVFDAILQSCLNFDIPLKEVSPDVYVLELFHGPTMAFKDVGAGFLAGCLNYYAREIDRKVVVLVATSGDTGSAVANGFYGQSNIEVVILYPNGKVTPFQEQQMTTLGGNISAVKVDGTFDDCQRLVKSAFLDKTLNEKLVLTSANSINIARFLSQSIYYFHAYNQWGGNDAPVFSVPSGNFGNLTAGLIANKMSMPVDRFIASVNINRTFTDYLESGEYDPRGSVPTLSNAMDVGDPSNFRRIDHLFHHHVEEVRSEITSYSFTDDDTLQAIKDVYENSGYLMDPHGAVGYLGLKKYGRPGIFLETAHPYKFHESIDSLEVDIPIPDQAAKFQGGEPRFTSIGRSFEEFREFLTNS